MTPPPPTEPPDDRFGRPYDGAGDDRDDWQRGWIHPDDRLWRHPSEVASTPPHGIPLAQAQTAHRYRGRLMMVVGVAAAAAAVAWVVVLLSPASERPPTVSASDASSDAPMTTLAASARAVPTLAEAASHSLVPLRVDTTHGVVQLTGVAVAEGGLVATTADALSGLRSIAMVGRNGQLLRASVMGVDQTSDMALINVPDDLPVPTFADDAALTGGAPDYTLTLAGSDTGAPTLRCEPGLVSAVGVSAGSGPAAVMPTIVSTTPAALVEPGDVLLNADGAVIGLLYRSVSTSSVTFLPSQLVLGVADDLRSSGRVAHGWLGVAGATNTSASGVTVMSVSSSGPAMGHLQPGEQIVGVNSVPVRSWAELVGRLYVMDPNIPVALSVLNGTTKTVVDVTLSPHQ